MRLLKVSGLDAYYGDFQAIYNVNIDLESGQTVALIGPNGAGKTTLLRSIAGWVSVDRRAIQFDGEFIGGRPANEVVALGVGLVPEGRRLFPSLTVAENLAMGQESGRTGIWTQEKVLEVFPTLRDRLHHLGSELSGGQQQMVAIGRALMSNPRLLLFDEFSLGLAPTVVNDIVHALPEVRAAGISIILVDQDVRRALAMSDYAYCILEGKINLCGPSDTIDFNDIDIVFFGKPS